MASAVSPPYTVLKLADVLMTRLVSLERSYMNNLKLVQQFAAQGAGASGEDLMSTEALGALMPAIAMKLSSLLVTGTI